MIRGILFDLDQTLLDRDRSLHAFLEWQTSRLFGEGTAPSANFIRRFIELDDYGRVWKDQIYGKLADEFDLTNASQADLLSDYVNRFCEFTHARPGASDTIRILSIDYQLGLISNGNSPFQERNFNSLGFANAFRSILVSEAIGIRKPDPRIFTLGCEQLGISPSEAIYVGDHPDTDIRGAIDAGLRAFFIPSQQYPNCQIAHATCDDLARLPEVLRNMNGD